MACPFKPDLLKYLSKLGCSELEGELKKSPSGSERREIVIGEIKKRCG